MEVGPSGEGGTGVLSIEVGVPPKEMGIVPPAGGTTGGGPSVPLMGEGLEMRIPPMNAELGGVLPREERRGGSSLLRPPCRLWLCTAAQRPSGRPSPTSLRSDNPFLLLLPLLLFLFSSSSSSSFHILFPTLPKSEIPAPIHILTHQLDLHFPRPEKMTNLLLLPPPSFLRPENSPQSLSSSREALVWGRVGREKHFSPTHPFYNHCPNPVSSTVHSPLLSSELRSPTNISLPLPTSFTLDLGSGGG